MNKSALACCSCSFFPFDTTEMLCYDLVLFCVSYVLRIPDWNGCFGLSFIQYFQPIIMEMRSPFVRIQIACLPLTGSAFDLFWAQCKSYVQILKPLLIVENLIDFSFPHFLFYLSISNHVFLVFSTWKKQLLTVLSQFLIKLIQRLQKGTRQ